jgi:uncharacterized membrane protein
MTLLSRKQSLFLLFVIGLCIGFIFTPYATSGEQVLETINYLPLMIISGVAALFSFIAIFLFRKENTIAKMNLKWQTYFVRIAILLLLGLIGTAVYFAIITPGEDMPHFGAAFPFAAWLFAYLAIRGIRLDRRRLREMDRLR